ncbi:MAG: cell division protein FtsQ/DivIB, partial [Terriglobales bacterium]
FWAWTVRRRRALAMAAVVLAAAWAAYRLAFDSPWFVLAGSQQIEIRGAHQHEQAAIRTVFASDLGRNVFFIPLAVRQRAVAAVPWVAHAAVLRLWPARLQIQIEERVPVAFVRSGAALALVDATGVILPHEASGHYDFPVLDGLAGASARDPDARRWLAARRPQMQQFAVLAQALAAASPAGESISEINVGTPGNLRAVIALDGGSSVPVQFGDANFAARYALFSSQIAAWRQKYPHLAGVDLRFDGQAIVDPGDVPPPPAARAPARRPGKAGHTASQGRRG